MNMRRKIILKELGLTPLWHIKHVKPEVSTQTAPTQTSEVTQPVAIQQMDWERLNSEVTNCTACPLSQTRTQTVFGVGDKHADWLCVGEGPGAREDALGEPFVGPAGKLLDNMLTAIGLKRGQQVYITNIVKCRPPNNRNPNNSEAQQCEPYLTRQIALIKPKLIIAFGKIAAQNLLGRDDSISRLRRTCHKYRGIPVIVTYHPAYLLRALPEKEKAWEDLCFARATMQSLPRQTLTKKYDI